METVYYLVNHGSLLICFWVYVLLEIFVFEQMTAIGWKIFVLSRGSDYLLNIKEIINYFEGLFLPYLRFEEIS